MGKLVQIQDLRINKEHEMFLRGQNSGINPYDDHVRHIEEHAKFLYEALQYGNVTSSDRVYKNTITNIRKHQRILRKQGFIYNQLDKRLETTCGKIVAIK